MDSAIMGRRSATAVHSTQPIHKSYPEVCTQHVDNAVDWLGITPGKTWVTGGEPPGMHSAPVRVHPPGTAAVPQIPATACEDDSFPRIHSHYDYDVLLTQENQVQ